MKDLRGANALVTGASGGIGAYIARALARAGTNVVVSGRRADALDERVKELSGLGVRAEAVTADLFDLGQIDPVLERAEAALGPIDVLVNNAGVEYMAAFTEISREELTSMVDLNLTVPLLLTHRVVPGMLERGRGHIVFISSLAGKMGPPYAEPYAATKAGLIGLTQSLRAEYVDSPVGFSVVCPGFVAGDGMYQRMVQEGVRANRLVGSTTVEKVADKVIDAILRDRPQVIVNSAPVSPLLALGEVSPRLIERMLPRTGIMDVFRSTAAKRGRV